MFWIGLAFGLVAATVYMVAHFAVAQLLCEGWLRLWRWLSFLPLPFFGYVLYITVLALQMDSNLWPIVMIFYAPFEFVYVAILVGLYLVTHRRHE